MHNLPRNATFPCSKSDNQRKWWSAVKEIGHRRKTQVASPVVLFCCVALRCAALPLTTMRKKEKGENGYSTGVQFFAYSNDSKNSNQSLCKGKKHEKEKRRKGEGKKVTTVNGRRRGLTDY